MGNAQRRKRDKMSGYGFKRFEAWIHHEDEESMREFVKSLNEPRLRTIAASAPANIVNGA